MSEWKPIETAPKDGTAVLLFLGNFDNTIALARWYSPWGNWVRDDEQPDPTEEYHGIGSGCPTHWMPLPSPPSDLKKGGEG